MSIFISTCAEKFNFIIKENHFLVMKTLLHFDIILKSIGRIT